MSQHPENKMQEKSNSAAPVALTLIALSGLLLAFFSDTDSTFYLRVIGILILGVSGVAAAIAFQRSK